jgi:hypothetical protein
LNACYILGNIDKRSDLHTLYISCYIQQAS